MLKDIQWAEDGTYRPGDKFSPERFFDDCLHNSQEFDLQLGYFNSAAISVLAEGFATFISNGGIMRLVINHIVSEEDKEAIKSGVSGNVLDSIDLTNFAELKKTFDEYQQQFFDCLSYLIFHRRIDIRIIRPLNKFGIAHTKSGQFRDGESITSFTGSANFTISGLFNNLEEIKIDRSISADPMIVKRISSQRDKFDQIMNKEMNNIEYLSPDNLISALTTNSICKDIEELLDVEKKLREIKEKKLTPSISTISDDSELVVDLTPQFPYLSGPRDYQKEAFENWKNNGQKGLFAMATGTGKTITSLNCLLEIYKRFGYYKALILVPTITLVEQWEKECLKFNFNNIIKVCSKNNDWKEDITDLRFQERFQGNGNKLSYVIISTYTSFTKESTFSLLADFPKNQLLLIADEAHNLGANNIKKIMPRIPYLRRIGLSATPDRQFDEAGNKAINNFFDIEDNKYTFEYSMKRAIENGVLCKYFYYPHIVRLTDDELDKYVELSVKIAKYFSVNSDSFVNKDPILTALLLKRKRIIHKAINKLEVFRSILNKRFAEKGNLKYTLIYVPEGNRPDDAEADRYTYTDYIRDDEYSEHLIDIYSKVVCDIEQHITVKKFTSESVEREILLKEFADGRLDVLTSMKCLDEGVDVPRSELAIFCSSTGNPRQFIQRRGRILRQHKEKQYATIHDLIVVPEINTLSDSFQMERSLLRSELKRVNNFALLSENPSYTCVELNDIMNYYGLTLFNNEIQ